MVKEMEKVLLWIPMDESLILYITSFLAMYCTSLHNTLLLTPQGYQGAARYRWYTGKIGLMIGATLGLVYYFKYNQNVSTRTKYLATHWWASMNSLSEC